MNLSELIRKIPDLVNDIVTKQRIDDSMIGQFHLGQQYEISTWVNNKMCGVYPCELERESIYYDHDGDSKTLKKVRITRVNIYLVVTETTMLVLETD